MSIEEKDQTISGRRMTSSYHEICATEVLSESESSTTLPEGAKKLLDRAKNWVGDLSLEGVVSQEGQQLTYVAEDLTQKIKVSKTKPTTNSQDHPGSSSSFDEFGSSKLDGSNQYQTYQQPGQDSLCDLNITVNEIELEAKKLASCVDTLTENLTGILHSLSSMTLDCVFTASDGVGQLCDTADASIKLMYQVMAKSEELNKSVVPLYEVQKQIQDTKKLLDRVEAEMN